MPGRHHAASRGQQRADRPAGDGGDDRRGDHGAGDARQVARLAGPGRGQLGQMPPARPAGASARRRPGDGQDQRRARPPAPSRPAAAAPLPITAPRPERAGDRPRPVRPWWRRAPGRPVRAAVRAGGVDLVGDDLPAVGVGDLADAGDHPLPAGGAVKLDHEVHRAGDQQVGVLQRQVLRRTGRRRRPASVNAPAARRRRAGWSSTRRCPATSRCSIGTTSAAADLPDDHPVRRSSAAPTAPARPG